MKYLNLSIIFLLISCGLIKEEDDGKSQEIEINNNFTKLSELSGQYYLTKNYNTETLSSNPEYTCSPHLGDQSVMKFIETNRTKIIQTEFYFNNPGCSERATHIIKLYGYMQIEILNNFNEEVIFNYDEYLVDTPKVTFKFDSASLTSLSDETTNAFNTAMYCGSNTWRTFESRDIHETNCINLTDKNFHFSYVEELNGDKYIYFLGEKDAIKLKPMHETNIFRNWKSLNSNFQLEFNFDGDFSTEQSAISYPVSFKKELTDDWLNRLQIFQNLNTYTFDEDVIESLEVGKVYDCIANAKFFEGEQVAYGNTSPYEKTGSIKLNMNIIEPLSINEAVCLEYDNDNENDGISMSDDLHSYYQIGDHSLTFYPFSDNNIPISLINKK